MIIKTGDELVQAIKRGEHYHDFFHYELSSKIKREEKAWELLYNGLGQYSIIQLDQFFNTVDYDTCNKRWFGQLFCKPNTRRIFESDLSELNNCIKSLIISDDKALALNNFFYQKKIKGAGEGFATLIFYLSNPECYNFMVKTTFKGVQKFYADDNIAGHSWGSKYTAFNIYANKFKRTYNFLPQEIDWFLFFIATYVEKSESGYKIIEHKIPCRNEHIGVG